MIMTKWILVQLLPIQAPGIVTCLIFVNAFPYKQQRYCSHTEG